MPRWVFAAAVLTLAVAFPAAPARAGLFSHHGGCDDCAPTCGVPYEATCCAPVECAPACQPTCCAPSYPTCGCPDACGDGCGEVYCDGCYQECEKECCLKRLGRKLWSLEKRKNACLKDTFLGWRKGGCCQDDCYECAPVEYYQPACGAPMCGAPCGCH